MSPPPAGSVVNYRAMRPPPTQAEADALGWYHTIDLGHGVVTKGMSDTVPLDGERFPDVEGRSVLDIGAWDGKNSFEAERRGASRVVALDHYVWRVDFGARTEYWNRCKQEGVLPDPDKEETDFFHEGTPGKAGFDFAHAALDSKVEAVVADFMTVDLDELGTFDVVLYLGVFYHIREPFAALRRLYRTTREVAVIETVAVQVSHHEHQPLLAFYAGDELSADFGNWYAPTERGLHHMCRAAGFSRVETKAGPPPPSRLPQRLRRTLSRRPPPPTGEIGVYRLVVHAFP